MDRAIFTFLIVATFLSALALVYGRHEGRRLFAELQELERVADRLNEEWGQLKLEESTWSTNLRIETLARQRLGMAIPEPDAIGLVTP
jgi:cell division protein FtsL